MVKPARASTPVQTLIAGLISGVVLVTVSFIVQEPPSARQRVTPAGGSSARSSASSGAAGNGTVPAAPRQGDEVPVQRIRTHAPDASAELKESLGQFMDETVRQVADGKAASEKARRSPLEILQAARERGADNDPVAYRLELEEMLRRSPEKAVEVARLLVEEMNASDGALLFQTALLLSANQDAETTEVLLAGLQHADPAARPEVVFALRGGEGPRVGIALLDLWSEELDPDVRARAGSVLSERVMDLTRGQQDQARKVARQQLLVGDERRCAAAGDVLGALPPSAMDRRTLIMMLRGSLDTHRRLAALRALASSGSSVDDLAADLEAIVADRDTPDDMKALARHLLQQR